MVWLMNGKMLPWKLVWLMKRKMLPWKLVWLRKRRKLMMIKNQNKHNLGTRYQVTLSLGVVQNVEKCFLENMVCRDITDLYIKVSNSVTLSLRFVQNVEKCFLEIMICRDITD